MNGSMQSLLVRDSASRLWIVKMRSDHQGPNALANEFLGTSLCQALGLPVPEVRGIQLTRAFFADKRTWFETNTGKERPKEGLHFASRYFPESTGKEVVDFLPATVRPFLKNRDDCLGIFLFDVWAMHTDYRQALFFADQGSMHMIFIDHGHLFGGPFWSKVEPFFGNRMMQSFAVQDAARAGTVDAWIDRMHQVLPSTLQTAISRVPTHWYAGDIQRLHTMLRKRLQLMPTLAASALQSTRLRVQSGLAFEQRLADSPIRVMSTGGAEHWF